MTTGNPADRRSAQVAIIVVRFKKPLHEISLLRALPMIDLSAVPEVIIVDNSPEPAPADEIATLPSVIKYRWLGGNVGLARAYNSAVEQLQSSWTHVVFLDQDTAGLPRLFDRLAEGLGAEVTLPAVRAGNAIISPCRRIGPWYLPLRRVGEVPANISWINSGMTVARGTVSSNPFDEELFLDYVDHQFARSSLAGGAHVEVCWDVMLDQDYSRDTDNEQQALARFRTFNRDVRQFYRGTLVGQLWGWALTLRRALGATVHYRTSAFIFSWLRTGRTSHG
ncbi:glycosyltransferase [Curtobacterium caseinilyticum]|uniref:Glycosyltransferase n=1 Tax=Curtobacterium caseinilyticum TaxID=3055137 RepID=A0ABT7TT12_9MICO|nr:glycosyltransferase [Curtobacterium caseinilyticum]MDM7891959.1 glycosyltransferase [Curtobacterium caseinilyticum]